MRSGLLREKITIQSYTEAQDTYGEPVKTWVDFAVNRWAQVQPLAGREYFSAKQTVASVDIRFVIRYIAGVLPKMRVIYGGDYYNIESVINIDERNRELHLMCVPA